MPSSSSLEYFLPQTAAFLVLHFVYSLPHTPATFTPSFLVASCNNPVSTSSLGSCTYRITDPRTKQFFREVSWGYRSGDTTRTEESLIFKYYEATDAGRTLARGAAKHEIMRRQRIHTPLHNTDRRKTQKQNIPGQHCGGYREG